MAARSRVPAGVRDVDVERVVPGGAGLGHVDGRVALVDGALPGDRVRAELAGAGPRMLRGRTLDIVSAGPHRRPEAEVCPRARDGSCGGCDWPAARLESHRALKTALVLDALRRLGGLEADGLPEPGWIGSPRSYRLRNRFHLGRDGRLVLQYRGKSPPLPPWEDLWLRVEPAPPGEEWRRLERVGLRAYRAAGPRQAAGLHRTVVATERDAAREIDRGAVSVTASAETLPLPADWGPVEALAAETGGKEVAAPEELFEGGGVAAALQGRFRLALVALGVLLLCIEALVNDRRWR